MNRKTRMVVGLQALIIVILAWMLVFYGKDEYENYQQSVESEVKTESHASENHGENIVTLSDSTQKSSGIETIRLAPSHWQPEFQGYGTVIDVAPLLELRSRYFMALADKQIAQTAVQASEHDFQRLHLLNQDNKNVSDRIVQIAEATYQSDLAKLEASKIAITGIHDTLLQQWGATLTKEAEQATPSKLFNQQNVLIQVLLPDQVEQANKILINPSNQHGTDIIATYVSPALHADNLHQGRTVFFRAGSPLLRTGMRVAAKFPKAEKPLAGVHVPESAVLWYLGQAWVYLQKSDESFVRKPLPSEYMQSDGWFDTHLHPGDRVVTTGAQLLLSEELKFQIKNENED